MAAVSLPVGASHRLLHGVEHALASRSGDIDAQSASPSREFLAEADGGAPRRHTLMLSPCVQRAVARRPHPTQARSLQAYCGGIRPPQPPSAPHTSWDTCEMLCMPYPSDGSPVVNTAMA